MFTNVQKPKENVKIIRKSKNIKINTKEVFYVEICKTPGGSPIILTLLVVKGNKKGPILVVSGGVHGLLGRRPACHADLPPSSR